jgi:3-oxoacyl-[acyl-carrier protein] reductase
MEPRPVEGAPSGTAALVTGASGALGGVAARVLATRGLPVALHAHAHPERAEELSRDLAVPTAVVGGDLGTPEGAEAVVAAAVEALGPVRVLVHCAGVRVDGLVVGQDPAVWAETIRVNLLGTFHVDRAVLPAMLKARWGRIVNVSSPVASFGNAGQSAYAASKAGVEALTRTLAQEVGRRSITVNALSPGFVASAITAEVADAARDRLLDRTALRRSATPDEIAPVLDMLLDAAYLTGQVVAVDGGMTP